ncbi:MAG TPA: exodeoxyribonuclease VII large subunit [Steroidobacteraceae bacterium]|nr:exodeoxyribonuclease VII large subunit [Steroidobacteraceae bacterium]
MAVIPEISGAALPAREVYSVTRLTREVRLLLERGLGVVWVEGELSNFSQPTSGHWYFSLKDRDAQLRCAMFRTKNVLVGFTPRPGMQVLVRGRVGVYEARGEYQLIAEHLEEAGLGALQREFERLRARLAAEGLFASERKRAVPRFPRRIGVVTSPTAAALHDVLNVLRRRFPPAQVLIYPAPVQGAAAAPALVRALDAASARAECDVLILARGGGSLEDLWAFNDERLARAIQRCALPVVCGVGHEIDFTIADFVADARAPTPSAAAELVVPDRHACLQALQHTMQRLAAGMRRELRVHQARLGGTQRRLQQAHPGARLNQQAQRLDDLALRLHAALRTRVHLGQVRLADARARLAHVSPRHTLREYRARQEHLQMRLAQSLHAQLARVRQRLAVAQRGLHAVSPLATLERGFAIVSDTQGVVIRAADELSCGQEFEARLARGTLLARVTAKK